MMAIPSAATIAKQQVQEVLDLVAVDGLPEDRLERRELLRLLSSSDTWVPTHCPETGRDLDGIDIIAHAQKVFPLNVPLRDMSVQALEREAALYRAAGAKPPVRR